MGMSVSGQNQLARFKELENEFFQSVDDAEIGTVNSGLKITMALATVCTAVGVGMIKLTNYVNQQCNNEAEKDISRCLMPNWHGYAFAAIGAVPLLMAAYHCSKVWLKKGCTRRHPEASQTAQVAKTKTILMKMKAEASLENIRRISPDDRLKSRLAIYSQMINLVEQERPFEGQNTIEANRQLIRIHMEFIKILSALEGIRD